MEVCPTSEFARPPALGRCAKLVGAHSKRIWGVIEANGNVLGSHVGVDPGNRAGAAGKFYSPTCGRALINS